MMFRLAVEGIVRKAHARMQNACAFRFGYVACISHRVVLVDKVAVVCVNGLRAVSAAAIAAVAARLAQAEDAGCGGRGFLRNV
jgi:hypothetical protein